MRLLHLRYTHLLSSTCICKIADGSKSFNARFGDQQYPVLQTSIFGYSIATNPTIAINDLWQIWQRLIKTPEDAAEVLTITLDRCRKCTLQTFVYLEYPDYLPEVHRLASAVMALEQVDQLYFTPIVNSANYSTERLFRLFGMNSY